MNQAGRWPSRPEHTLVSTDLSGNPLVITVVPQRGGKITSLASPSHEWLSQPAGELPLRSPCGLGFVEAEMCGWDECAPTIVAGQTAAGTVLSDHGDLWDQAWHWSRTAEALTTWAHGLDWAYTLTRTIRPIEGGFRLDYEVSSKDPVPQPFLWAAHPQFLAEPDSWVELEGVTQVVDFQAPERPLAVDRSLQRVPDGTSRKFWTLPGDVVQRATLHHPDGRRLDLSWTGEAVRWCGVWIDAHEYSADRVIAIEPATGWHDSASRAQANQTVLTLAPGARAAWTLELTVA